MPASRKYKKTYNTIYLNIMRGGERKGKESGSTKSVNREKLFKEKFSPYHSLALALALALALSLHFHFTYNLSSRFYFKKNYLTSPVFAGSGPHYTAPSFHPAPLDSRPPPILNRVDVPCDIEHLLAIVVVHNQNENKNERHNTCESETARARAERDRRACVRVRLMVTIGRLARNIYNLLAAMTPTMGTKYVLVASLRYPIAVFPATEQTASRTSTTPNAIPYLLFGIERGIKAINIVGITLSAKDRSRIEYKGLKGEEIAASEV